MKIISNQAKESRGIALDHKLRPFVLGIVLGECFIGGIWIIVGLMTGIGYRLLPG